MAAARLPRKGPAWENREDRDIALGRGMPYALRHVPQRYGLESDREGWTTVAALVDALGENPRWARTCRHRTYGWPARQKATRSTGNGFVPHAAMLCGGVSRKPRRLRRAFPVTERRAAQCRQSPPRAQADGRHYAHLSADAETALLVGAGRDREPALFEVDARAAARSGTRFCCAPGGIWLSEPSAPEFLRLRAREGRPMPKRSRALRSPCRAQSWVVARRAVPRGAVVRVGACVLSGVVACRGVRLPVPVRGPPMLAPNYRRAPSRQ